MFLEFSSNLSVKIWKTFYLEVFATGEDLNGRPEALHLSSAHTCGESPAWGCFFCPWPQLKAHFFFRIKPQSSVPTDTHTPKRNVYQSTFSILANFFFFKGIPDAHFIVSPDFWWASSSSLSSEVLHAFQPLCCLRRLFRSALRYPGHSIISMRIKY